MVHIVFIPHATTAENEQEVASGHSLVGLSPTGVAEATALQGKLQDITFDAAYTSDLPRAAQTIKLALAGSKLHIMPDKRLREINYGELTGKPRPYVRERREQYIHVPFPGGESYDDALARMTSFLDELKQKYQGKTVAICGHGVYPLEVLINQKPLTDALNDWVDGVREFTLT